MLVLSRRLGEAIIIGDNIRVAVVGIQGNHVRLGCTAPEDILIYREELCGHLPGRAKKDVVRGIGAKSAAKAPCSSGKRL
ncbi:MAG TPA: carbon storage regulator [Gemmataceae bacterium]|jgi:carbon storage regulator|nr:carbon storage regulator [Gemmataceae bacterium]